MTNPYRELAYEVYLTTVHWEKTRKRKLSQANYKCEKCPRGEPLEVHHLTYERLGEELMEDLQALCPICHCNAHGREPTIDDWNRCGMVFGWENALVQKAMRIARSARFEHGEKPRVHYVAAQGEPA